VPTPTPHPAAGLEVLDGKPKRDQVLCAVVAGIGSDVQRRFLHDLTALERLQKRVHLNSTVGWNSVMELSWEPLEPLARAVAAKASGPRT
jgi:hypothetical protein